ncbi:MAG: DinB family protein [Chloroflexi bacterium]|nr:DinB family protein [Chloroflexota bacterium]
MTEEVRIKELQEKMAEERGKLLSTLERLSDEEASTPLKPEEWTAKQQMSHLCEMESAYRAWVEKALAEDGANLDGVQGEPVAIPLERAHLNMVSEHVTEMRAQRQKTLAVMERMRPQDYDRTATSAVFGTLTVMQWLRSYYRHDRMHYDQVRGEEPTYKPQFRSGKEPDQRRPAAAG